MSLVILLEKPESPLLAVYPVQAVHFV